MRRGEIWWTSPRLASGSRKRRPVLIVSHDGFNGNPRYPTVLVVYLTKRHSPGRPFPWDVQLPRGAGGLRHASVASCAEIYTLLKDRLADRWGALSRPIMAKVDRALATALDLPAPPDDRI